MSYGVLSKYRAELMGAAILWVMLFHAYGLDLGHWTINWVRSIGFGGVDIFILLSAMGLAMSLGRREQEYSSFMARRAGRVLPAYYIVMVPYTVFLILHNGAPWSALIWNSLLLYYWVRPDGSFNWYVACIMLFYAITPMCFRRLRRSRHRALLTSAGVLGGLLICQVLMHDGFWDKLDIMYRIPVFFLGLLLGFYVLDERKISLRDALFWCCWAGLGVIYLFARRQDIKVVALPLCHLFLFTTVPMCLVLCTCLSVCSAPLCAFWALTAWRSICLTSASLPRWICCGSWSPWASAPITCSLSRPISPWRSPFTVWRRDCGGS